MSVFETAKHVAADVGQTVLGAGSELEAAGKHAFSGVVDGVKTQAKTLSDAAATLANGVEKAKQDAAVSVRHQDVLGAVEHIGHDLSAGGGAALSLAWGGTARATGQVAAGLHQSVLDAGGAVGAVYGHGAEAARDVTAAVAGKRAGEVVDHVLHQAGGGVSAVARTGFSGVTAASKVAGGMVRGTGDLVIGSVRMGTDAEYRDKLVARAKDVALAIGDKELAAMRDPATARHQVAAWAKGEVKAFTDEARSAQAKGELPEFVGDKTGAVFAQLATFAVPAAKGEQAVGAVERAAMEFGDAAKAVDGAGADAVMAGGARAARATGDDATAAERFPAGPAEGRRYAQDVPAGKGKKGVPANPGQPSGGKGQPATAGSGDAGRVPPKPPVQATGPAPSDPEGDGSVRPRADDGAISPQQSAAKRAAAPRGAVAKAAGIDKAARRAAASMTRSGESGSAKAADLKLVLDHIARHVPAPIMDTLHASGVEIIVGRDNVTDHFKDLKGKITDLRDGGRTWDGVAGVYWSKTKTMSVSTELDPVTKAPRLIDVAGSHSVDLILHEIGHSIDHNVAGGTLEHPLSGEDVFTWACHLDRSAIRTGFPVPGTPSEAFAEGWARYRLNPEALRAEAPHLYGYFDNLDKAGGEPITWESMAAHMPQGAEWRKPPGAA